MRTDALHVISQRLSIQFNIYQSRENVVLFLEHIMLATLNYVLKCHIQFTGRGEIEA